MNRFLDSLTNLYYNKDNSLPLSVSLEGIGHLSFTAFGYADINTLVFLIDNYKKYTDSKSRALFSTVAYELIAELTPDRRLEIIDALKTKYYLKSDDSVNKIPLLEYLIEA